MADIASILSSTSDISVLSLKGYVRQIYFYSEKGGGELNVSKERVRLKRK